jgi:hypothetical protein
MSRASSDYFGNAGQGMLRDLEIDVCRYHLNQQDQELVTFCVEVLFGYTSAEFFSCFRY